MALATSLERRDMALVLEVARSFLQPQARVCWPLVLVGQVRLTVVNLHNIIEKVAASVPRAEIWVVVLGAR